MDQDYNSFFQQESKKVHAFLIYIASSDGILPVNPRKFVEEWEKIAFAIALELDMPMMMDLLARAEIAFSPSNKFDLIITYFITNKVYDIYEINAALFKYGQPILGE